MKIVYKILLAFSSTSLLLSIFLIKSKIYIFETAIESRFIEISLFLYLLIPITSTALVLFSSRFLGKDKFKKGEILEIEYAGNNFLPSYLGYFFVALSIADKDFFTMSVVYLILLVFVFVSKTFYFNPVFMLFGYHFYQVKTMFGLTVFLVTRKRFKRTEDIEEFSAHRINDFTFIER